VQGSDHDDGVRILNLPPSGAGQPEAPPDLRVRNGLGLSASLADVVLGQAHGALEVSEVLRVHNYSYGLGRGR